MRIRLLFLFAFLFIAHNAYSTEYFTAKDCTGGSAPPLCSNSNNGTSRQTAKLTINAGIALMSSCDTLTIGNGNYAERIWTTNRPPSGTAGVCQTIIRAENNRGVTVQPTDGACCYAIAIQGRNYVTIDGLIGDGTQTASNVCSIDFDSPDTAIGNIIQNSTCRNGYGADSSGIFVGGPNAQILNNIVSNVGNLTGNPAIDQGCVLCGAGIYLPMANAIIDGNVIDDANGYIIQLTSLEGGVSNNIVRNNIFSNSRLRGVVIQAGTGNLFYNNLVFGNYRSVEINAQNTGFYNNVLYNNGHGGFWPAICHVLGASTIRNNILDGNYSDTIDSTGAVQSGCNGGTITNSNNRCDSGCATTASPGFTDAPNDDFTLTLGSAMIDAGMTLADVDSDFIGTARPQPSGGAYDLGAYEFFDEQGDPDRGVAVDTDTFTTASDSNLEVYDAANWKCINDDDCDHSILIDEALDVVYPNTALTGELSAVRHAMDIWSENHVSSCLISDMPDSGNVLSCLCQVSGDTDLNYDAYFASTNSLGWAILDRVENNTFSNMAIDTGAGITVGDALECSVNGATVSLMVDEVTVLSEVDADPLAPGRPGIGGEGTNGSITAAFTSWAGYNYDAPDPPSATITMITPVTSSSYTRPGNVTVLVSWSTTATSGTFYLCRSSRGASGPFVPVRVHGGDVQVTYNAGSYSLDVAAAQFPASTTTVLRLDTSATCAGATAGVTGEFTVIGEYLQ